MPPTTASLAADPNGALAYDTTELTMAAGEPTIQFTNKSGTDHDVTIEDANGNVIGQSKVIANGSTAVRLSPSPTPTRSTARQTATARPAWRGR